MAKNINSAVEYLHDFEKMLHLHVNANTDSERVLAHYQLYNKVSNATGSIVKCGVTKEGFSSFVNFMGFLVTNQTHSSIAFEKVDGRRGNLRYSLKPYAKQRGITENTSQAQQLIAKTLFINGNIGDTIPAYLIENPELKISYLHVDLDDYEASLTTLQFFYPRLIHGGILVLDNYYKKEDDYEAATDYFANDRVTFNNFAVNRGPHYFIRR